MPPGASSGPRSPTSTRRCSTRSSCLTSELVTNAVIHAGSEPRLVLVLLPDRIRVEVHDADPTLPAQREPDAATPRWPRPPAARAARDVVGRRGRRRRQGGVVRGTQAIDDRPGMSAPGCPSDLDAWRSRRRTGRPHRRRVRTPPCRAGTHLTRSRRTPRTSRSRRRPAVPRTSSGSIRHLCMADSGLVHSRTLSSKRSHVALALCAPGGP